MLKHVLEQGLKKTDTAARCGEVGGRWIIGSGAGALRRLRCSHRLTLGFGSADRKGKAAAIFVFPKDFNVEEALNEP